jgi:hypothetical protein
MIDDPFKLTSRGRRYAICFKNTVAISSATLFKKSQSLIALKREANIMF